MLGNVDPTAIVAEGYLVDVREAFVLGLDDQCCGKVEVLLLGGAALLRIEVADASQCLLEQGVVGMLRVGQDTGRGSRLLCRVQGLLGQWAHLAVHR